MNTDINLAQEITKDEVNSADVYIDSKAIEEITEGFPTIGQSVDFLVDKAIISAKQAELINILDACHNAGGSASFNINDFLNGLIASPAYANPGCAELNLDEIASWVDDDTLRLVISSCSDPRAIAWAEAYLARSLFNGLPADVQNQLQNLGWKNTEDLVDLIQEHPEVAEIVLLIQSIKTGAPNSGGDAMIVLSNGLPNSVISTSILEDVEVPTQSQLGIDTTGWSIDDYIMLVVVEQWAMDSAGGLGGVAVGQFIGRFGAKGAAVLRRAFNISDEITNPDDIARAVNAKAGGDYVAVPKPIGADIPSNPVHNINEFFNSITGKVFQSASSRTNKTFQGQRVYQASKDIILQDGTKFVKAINSI